jgi:hypothetical protein
MTSEGNVLRHGAIERLEDDLWRVVGSLPHMGLRRVMTLVRLRDRRVVIHSAIALDEASMAEIERWGTPSVLIVPGVYHRLDAPAYVARYPDLQVVCPRGARTKVAQKVRVDRDYESYEGSDRLDLVHLDGVGEAEGVAMIRTDRGTTLVFNDALFNMPHGRGLAGLVFRYVTDSTGGPRVTRLFRVLAVRDRRALADHLRRFADTPDLVRVIVSHHAMIDERPAAVLREIASSLS